ncbi:MAG: hypothetical protein ACKOC8_09615 [Pirellulales bacterium]
MKPPSSAIIGVDFTSAPRPRKPITVAVGTLAGGRRDPVYRLEAVHGIAALDGFAAFLREPLGWIGGFDLPFGQPRSLIEHEGWPTDWRRLVRWFCAEPRDSLRDVFRRWCAGRPAGDKFAWRKADKPAGSSPAMRWTNPPVAWMMHAGIGRMLDAGLSFPAHRVAGRGSGRGRIALEAYPGFTARQACRRSYKSDTPAAQTADRRDNRRTILRALEAGTTGLDVRLELSPGLARQMIDDGAGDLLDAAICGLQAAHASIQPGYGLPRDLDPLEGWIASVPPRSARSTAEA